MKPIILDGKKLAKEIEENLKQKVLTLKEKTGIVPFLAIILIGLVIKKVIEKANIH